MLILSREPNPGKGWIVFPQLDAAFGVVGLEGDRVKLLFQAPPEVQVLRREVLDSNPEKYRRRIYDLPPPANSYSHLTYWQKGHGGLRLTRKPDEEVIFDPADIVIIGVKGDNVKVGVDAPNNFIVVREEVLIPGRELHRPSREGQISPRGESGVRPDGLIAARRLPEGYRPGIPPRGRK